MNRTSIAVFVLSCAAALGLAWLAARTMQTAEPSTPSDEADTTAITEVMEAVTHYANGIACDVMRIDPQDVVLLAHTPFDEGGNGARFAALWTGDIGCTGGSGTTFTNIAIVRNDDRESGFFVDPQKSSPIIDFDSPVRVVMRVADHSHDTLTLEGMEHGDRAPNCCPTLPVRFTLRADEGGHWRLGSKTQMESAPEGW